MLLTERYRSDLHGVLTCYDRTPLGRSAVAAGLKIKNMLLTSEFSNFSVAEA